MKEIHLRIYEAGDPRVEELLAGRAEMASEAESEVAKICAAVKERGDAAVIEYTARFGGPKLEPGQLTVSGDEIREAYRQVGGEFLAALRAARHNIASFHRRQLRQSWFVTGEDGVVLGQLVRPVRRAGIYVPGGKAAYPSSVLMNAVPAQVAGVKEIAMATPPAPDGSVNPHTLVAAAEAGVEEIYRMGGAQAVAALAFGTETVRRVDVITGPGNIYVTLAKKYVTGWAGIDMLAGPSEVVIVADHTADPVFVAADLLSQAEHDEMASAILITPCRELAQKVAVEAAALARRLPRREIIASSLAGAGAVIVTGSLEEAFEVANRLAPEHLELMVAEPFCWLWRVENAGAVFLGSHSPEPVGDYLAGPNHILPTGGTARFCSPLGVDTFLKKTSLISYTPRALEKAGREVMVLAETEGLAAHAAAVAVRLERYGQDKSKRE